MHESMRQDNYQPIMDFHWSVSDLINGSPAKQYLGNIFTRWHESFENYPSHLSDQDDVSLYETDDFERLKPFKAAKKDVVGTTSILPKEDNDEKWEFYDIQGESLYSHPPDHNNILVDHGLDEETIWVFPKTLAN